MLPDIREDDLEIATDLSLPLVRRHATRGLSLQSSDDSWVATEKHMLLCLLDVRRLFLDVRRVIHPEVEMVGCGSCDSMPF